MLVRYVMGSYTEDGGSTGAAPGGIAPARRSSVSSFDIHNSPYNAQPQRYDSQDDVSRTSSTTLNQGGTNGFVPEEKMNSTSPIKTEPSPIDRNVYSDAQNARRILDRGIPSSLPDSSPLSNASPVEGSNPFGAPRSNSELGNYPDLAIQGRRAREHSPEQHRKREPTYQPSLDTLSPSPIEPNRAASPDKVDAKDKISGPTGATLIPAGMKFGSKDPVPDTTALSASERREKAKSRSFWGFGRSNRTFFFLRVIDEATHPLCYIAGDKPQVPTVTYTNRPVFGVALEESLDVVQICNLPAVIFRCIQYLEAKKADQEEGIYRLSGSSAVIKGLKDRFNLGELIC